MRIGIDARELCGQPTGVGRYLQSLLNEWRTSEAATRHRFVLYSPEALSLEQCANWETRVVVSGGRGVWWEQVRLPAAARQDRLDVFFAPAYTAPLMLDTPMVVNIHDVSFAAHPEWFRLREGLRRRWLTRAAVRRACAILTVSNFSRREIVDRLGARESRVHVVPHGTNAKRTGGQEESAPMVLFVGSIFNRRHVPDLVRAFGRLAQRRNNVSLEIVGDNRSYPHEDVTGTIAGEHLDGRARWRAYVPDAELQRLYARAGAFAFLSEYEGFGLTPIEALSAGVPPVLLDTAVARETCGGAALYVSSNDIDAIAAALDRALFDPDARAEVLAAAPSVLARYSWPRAAQDTLAILESCAAR